MSDAKKKLYIAVLVFGGVALLVDRVILSSADVPESANASTVSMPSPTAAMAPSGPAISVAAAPFPETTQPLMISALRDAFAITPTIESALLGTPEGAPGAEQADATPTGAAALEANHRLDGVMTGDGTGVAIVDGTWLRKGDVLDDCTLTEISGTRAMFRCSDGEATLSVTGLLETSSGQK